MLQNTGNHTHSVIIQCEVDLLKEVSKDMICPSHCYRCHNQHHVHGSLCPNKNTVVNFHATDIIFLIL